MAHVAISERYKDAHARIRPSGTAKQIKDPGKQKLAAQKRVPALQTSPRPIISRAVPTIDLTDAELAAVTAAIRRAIEDDRFPRAPRLDPLRSALAKLPLGDGAAQSQPRSRRRSRQPKAEKRARR